MHPSTKSSLSRRDFIRTSALTLAVAGAQPVSAWAASAETKAAQVPLKIGIRAVTMNMVGDVAVIRTGAGMPGIAGVELQVTAGARNLRDMDVVREYKRESNRWNVRIPSVAGIWDKGVNI